MLSIKLWYALTRTIWLSFRDVKKCLKSMPKMLWNRVIILSQTKNPLVEIVYGNTADWYQGRPSWPTS